VALSRPLRRAWRRVLRAVAASSSAEELTFEHGVLPIQFCGLRCLECGQTVYRGARRRGASYVLTCPNGHAAEVLDLGSDEAVMARRPALDLRTAPGTSDRRLVRSLRAVEGRV
jgi:hypothetical protein